MQQGFWLHPEGVYWKTGAAQLIFLSRFHSAFSNSSLLQYWFIRTSALSSSLKRTFEIHQPVLRLTLQSISEFPEVAVVRTLTNHVCTCRSLLTSEEEPFVSVSTLTQLSSWISSVNCKTNKQQQQKINKQCAALLWHVSLPCSTSIGASLKINALRTSLLKRKHWCGREFRS